MGVEGPGFDELPERTELLAALAGREGDPRASQELFERLRPFLASVVRTHPTWGALRSSVSEEDLVHEVVERVLRTGVLARLEDRGPRSVRRTLASVVDHVLRDHARARGALRRGGDRAPARSIDTELGSMLPALGVPTPTSEARANDLIEICRSMLTDEEFEIWRRAHVEGVSSEEIGRALGKPASTVRGVLQDVRLRLVRRLSDLEDDSP